ncbi:uncharacterized protein C8A04DRAFT_15959 [Dichotomopilus funicola]|uniref:Carboxylesterase family protein n=1 Tax=Dichotomopilus funicola TaxID=1934379 RepID=A0AAN6UU78_9PEZI|nr:hypothetical protein C8A04DRAFT_15959 [Dichotomopilus funicola]
MATISRPRQYAEPDIHNDLCQKENANSIPYGVASSALGELPLNSIHNVGDRKTSVESLAHRLDGFHLNNPDKENALRPSTGTGFQVLADTLNTKESTQKACSAATNTITPRSGSHGDAELSQGEKMVHFGCNLVERRSASDTGAMGDGKPTNMYTLLATRVKAEEEFMMDVAPVFAEMELAVAAERLRLSEAASMTERQYGTLDVPKSPGLMVEINDLGSDIGEERSRPVSRIEDSVEALDRLEEEIEALSQIAHLGKVLSPEAGSRKLDVASPSTTPLKRATSVRTPHSARSGSRPLERSASVRQSSSVREGEKTSTSARKVARPASLLPPKPLAKSDKAPTMSTFQLPGEAVARRLKEQREQRRSQHISEEEAAAIAAAYSPAKPHFKSTKAPTRPTFELPGEAISRRKREEHQAKLRAQEEEERKRREFKARPIRSSVTPGTFPRETLASLARQKTRSTEGSTDSGSTAVTPTLRKRQSIMGSASSATSATANTNLTPTTTPGRGRHPTAEQPATRGTSSSSTAAASVHSRGSTHSSTRLSADEAAQQRVRGKEVFARDNSYTAEREREKRERERAAREAREKAAERSRELSRLWAEKQRVKMARERMGKGQTGSA